MSSNFYQNDEELDEVKLFNGLFAPNYKVNSLTNGNIYMQGVSEQIPAWQAKQKKEQSKLSTLAGQTAQSGLVPSPNIGDKLPTPQLSRATVNPGQAPKQTASTGLFGQAANKQQTNKGTQDPFFSPKTVNFFKNALPAIAKGASTLKAPPETVYKSKELERRLNEHGGDSLPIDELYEMYEGMQQPSPGDVYKFLGKSIANAGIASVNKQAGDVLGYLEQETKEVPMKGPGVDALMELKNDERFKDQVIPIPYTFETVEKEPSALRQSFNDRYSKYRQKLIDDGLSENEADLAITMAGIGTDAVVNGVPIGSLLKNTKNGAKIIDNAQKIRKAEASTPKAPSSIPSPYSSGNTPPVIAQEKYDGLQSRWNDLQAKYSPATKELNPLPTRKEPDMPPPWAREQPNGYVAESHYGGYASEGYYPAQRNGNNPPAGIKSMDDIVDKSLDVNDPRNVWTNTKGIYLEPVQNDEKIVEFFKDWDGQENAKYFAREKALKGTEIKGTYKNAELGDIDISGQGIREAASKCYNNDGSKSLDCP